MPSPTLSKKITEILHIYQRAKEKQFANMEEVLLSRGSVGFNPFEQIQSIFGDVKSEVEQGRAVSVFDALLPLTDELATGSNAFCQAASGCRTLSVLVDALLTLCYFADVPLNIMNVFNQQKSIIKPTDIAPEILERLLASTRLILSLPAQIEKLFSFLNRPYTRGDVLSSNLCGIMSFSVYYARAFSKFTLNFGHALQKSAPHQCRLRNLFSSSLDLSVLANLLEVSGDLLHASLTGRLPSTPRPVALEMYASTVSEALLLFDESGPTSATDLSDRLMSRGTWATPYFAGIEQLVMSCEEGTRDPSEKSKQFVMISHILIMPMYAYALDPRWQARAKTVKIVAKPQFQEVAMDVLIRVEKWLATTPEIEPSLRCSAMLLPLAGYGFLVEANRAKALLDGVSIHWVPMTRALSSLGDLWVKLGGALPSAGRKELATASALVSRSIRPLVYDILGPRGADISKISGEEVVPVLRTVERLATIIATTPQVLSSINIEGFQQPIGEPLYLARGLSDRCKCYVEERKEELQGGPLIGEVGAAALAAIETIGKATRLLVYFPPELRKCLIPVPTFLDSSEEVDEGSEGEVAGCVEGKSDTNEWWVDKLTGILAPLLHTLQICSEIGGPKGEQQAACAVMTVGEDFVDIGDTLNDVAETSMFSLSALKVLSQQILSRCILPRDHDNMKLICNSVYTYGGDAIIKNLCEVAKGADRRDPERMKVRAQVLGHRSCGHLSCYNLRSSSEKPFGKLCAGCKAVRYCCVDHQKEDWKKGHKIGCKELQKMLDR